MIVSRASRVAILIAVVAVSFASCSAERRDWRSAQSADSIESYGRFLSRHPEGQLAAEARTRIAQLTEERDWKRAMQIDTASGYERFLAQHPSGRWAQEARIRAETFVLSDTLPGMSSAARPDGTYHVQLGAFGSEFAAREAWRRLVEQFQGELHGLTPDISAAQTASGSLYRLQARVPDEPAARELCGALERQGQGCAVVLPQR
jgi:hypothetical protein